MNPDLPPPPNLLYWKPGRYIDSASTDLAKTFACVRKEMAQQAKAQAATNVKELRRA